jgi:hypothetical protein
MKRNVAAFLATVILAGTLSLGVAAPARAEGGSEKMWRIGTYALGAGTAYAFARKKGTLGLIGAAGTYLAYRQWKNQVNKRHKNRRSARYVRRRR